MRMDCRTKIKKETSGIRASQVYFYTLLIGLTIKGLRSGLTYEPRKSVDYKCFSAVKEDKNILRY